MSASDWPALPLDDWLPTYATLHRWMQIVGKTRLALCPFQNHWWHTTLYVTARGLTTSTMPYAGGHVEAVFDFVEHTLCLGTSEGQKQCMTLANRSVSDFYKEYCDVLKALGVRIRMHAAPNELSDATPFAEDHANRTYDPWAVQRWWTALAQADHALKQFRGLFVGKSSPSHFWWGGFDLACTLFSGRRAPEHPGGIPNCPDYVMREAYSHECISAGWWPGSAGSPVAEAAFYAYAYPEPAGCNVAPIRPGAAAYHPAMREWILPYEAVRTSSDPQAMIAAFLESTYETAATLGGWDVASLRSSRDAAGAAQSAKR